MELFYEILDALLDTLKDCALIIPFMFAAYLVIGLLERGAGRRMVSVILAADRVGPLAGGVLGVLPSCGFSAAASNLFGAGLLTAGTLVAVFVSTSDEMLAVMVSQRTDVLLILKILAIKAGSAIVCGFIIDGVIRLYCALSERRRAKKERAGVSGEVSEQLAEDAAECGCGCGDTCCAAKGNLFLSALLRTTRIVAFIFLISIAINIAMLFVDESVLAGALSRFPALSCAICAVVGLIPNCAVSVAMTELYLDGVITAQAMLCGLMTGAGSGLLVLFRANKSLRENLGIVAALLVSGFTLGTLSGWLFF